MGRERTKLRGEAVIENEQAEREKQKDRETDIEREGRGRERERLGQRERKVRMEERDQKKYRDNPFPISCMQTLVQRLPLSPEVVTAWTNTFIRPQMTTSLGTRSSVHLV